MPVLACNSGQSQALVTTHPQKTVKIASVAAPEKDMLAQNIAPMYSQNIQETYGEYYLRQLQTGKTPLSQAAHNRNKMVLIGFVSSEIDSLTTSEAGQAILSGMSQQMRTEAIGFAKNLAFGTIIRCAAPYIAGAVAPEFLATGYAGMALFSLYQNGGAVLHTGAELVDALHQKEYAQIGSKCVGLTLCITSLGASAKNTIIHCKNAPELYAALAKHFKTDRLALAGIPQANFAVSIKAQSTSNSKNSKSSAQPRNANKASIAQAAEVARQQKIKARFGDNAPNFIKNNTLPNDSDTILFSGHFIKTKHNYQGAAIYKGKN